MAETSVYEGLKSGDTALLTTSPGTSRLITLVIADGTTVELTITGNTPCKIVCGSSVEINIHVPPDPGFGVTHLGHGNVDRP